MTLDNLDPRDSGREDHAPSPESERKTPEQEPTLTDREVPLSSAQTPEAIHAWLDGESVNEEQLHAAERSYEFWLRVQEETGRRRRMMTPSHIPAQIMSALKKDG